MVPVCNVWCKHLWTIATYSTLKGLKLPCWISKVTWAIAWLATYTNHNISCIDSCTKVVWNGQPLRFYARFCGTKGDWPFLRSCYRLSTGFTSKRICHICPSTDTQLNALCFLGPLEVLRSPVVYSNHYKSMLSKDWTDLSRHGATRNWPKDGISPSPFHRGRKASIRNMLPSGGVKTIRIDLAHTYAIAGWGKEQVASLLVLVAVRCSLFGNGGYEDQLKWAFDSFSGWCQLHSKTSTIHEFSKKELKISSLLEQTIYWDFIVVIFLISTCHHSSLIPKSQLRLQKYPRGLGKGSDCALVGGWLESILTPLDPATVPASCRHFWVYRPPKNMWLFFWHPFWGLKFFKCMGSPYLVSDILVTSNPSHVCISPILCVTPDNRTTI